MLQSESTPPPAPYHPDQLFSSVLENAEVGVVVVDSVGRAVYLNASGRSLLEAESGYLPDWAADHLRAVVDKLDAAGGQVLERWPRGDAVLRVRARPLPSTPGYFSLEITVAHVSGGPRIAHLLARSLRLSLTDAELLALVWRGMTNDEIGQTLGIRVGTVKSRLFRLYQRLGVKRRPAAALRAAEVLRHG